MQDNGKGRNGQDGSGENGKGKAASQVSLEPGHRVRFDMPPPRDWTGTVTKDTGLSVSVRRDGEERDCSCKKRDLRELDGSPLKPSATTPNPSGVNKAMTDPHRLARIYLERYKHTDGYTLRYWNEEWYVWNGSCYRLRLREEIRSEISSRCEEEFNRLNLLDLEEYRASGSDKPRPVAKPVTTRLVGDVESAIKSLVTLMVEEGGTGSTWIDNYSDWPIDEIIPVRNAVIRLAPDASLMTIPPTPNLFSIYSLQYNYVSDSPKPVEWLKFLRTIWGDDHDAINTLGEWFGYSLLPSSQYQKMLMMIGPPRSGKGTIARVLGSMVGRENIIGPTLQQFNTSFGMSAFICKLVAVIADARLQGSLLSSQGVILERLLAISGGDELTCDRKFKSHVTMRLTTKIVFLSNDIPEFRDSSEAVVTRFIYLKLTESFLNREDKGLFDRLVQELPSILLWAIEGLWRLRERGHFIQPETGRSLFRQMSSTASPIKQFVEERCILDGEIRAGKLFNEWELWCLENKRDVGKPQRFGRDLHAAFPKIEVKQKRYEEMGGTNRDTYYGIQLRPPEQYEPNPESIVAVPY